MRRNMIQRGGGWEPKDGVMVKERESGTTSCQRRGGAPIYKASQRRLGKPKHARGPRESSRPYLRPSGYFYRSAHIRRALETD